MNKFLMSIAKGEDGFSYGDIWRYKEESSIVTLPILRDSDGSRAYISLQEAEKVKISDTGMIDKVSIESHEDRPIYVRMGEIFCGKTQERMAIRSYIVMPGDTISVDVCCVHLSRGIQTGADMTADGFAPVSFEIRLSDAFFVEERVDQSQVWNTVQETSQRMSESASSLSASTTSSHASSTMNGITGPTGHTGGRGMSAGSDDLKASMDEFSELFKEVLEKVPHFDNQVGLAVIDKDGPIGIEAFDFPESWKQLRDGIIKKDASDIVAEEEDSLFVCNRNKIVGMMDAILYSKWTEKVVYESGDYRVIGLKTEDYVGEITELCDEVIHAMVVRKRKKPTYNPTPSSPRSGNPLPSSPSTTSGGSHQANPRSKEETAEWWRKH